MFALVIEIRKSITIGWFETLPNCPTVSCRLPFALEITVFIDKITKDWQL